ncbi:MAG TPA: hypothetical protein VJP59_05965 [Gemmatimonadota bacterium]|nr:hypothetical protein [Gemmatimonadota bacterium]
MDIVSQFKKGWQTSEFWVMLVSLLTPIIALITGYDVDTEGAVYMIGLIFGGVGYATNRTWLKRARVNAVAGAGDVVTIPPDMGDGDANVGPDGAPLV